MSMFKNVSLSFLSVQGGLLLRQAPLRSLNVNKTIQNWGIEALDSDLGGHLDQHWDYLWSGKMWFEISSLWEAGWQVQGRHKSEENAKRDRQREKKGGTRWGETSTEAPAPPS